MIQDSVNAQELYRMFKALYDFLAVRRSYRLVRPFFFFFFPSMQGSVRCFNR